MEDLMNGRRVPVTIGKFYKGIHVDETKVNAVQDWSSPKTLPEEGRRIAMVSPKVTPQLSKSEVKVDEQIVKAEVVDEHIEKIKDLQSYKQHDDKISTFLFGTTNKVRTLKTCEGIIVFNDDEDVKGFSCELKTDFECFHDLNEYGRRVKKYEGFRVDVKRKSTEVKVRREKVFEVDESLDIENSRASSFQVRGIHVDETKVNAVQDCLSSGLFPSLAKSDAFFGNVYDVVKADIMLVMPFKEGVLPIKYLGLPMHAQPEDTNELFQKLLEDLQIISEELTEYINSPSWNHPTFYDDDEEHSIQYKEYLENSSNAIIPVLPTEEPEYSLSMGYEHLSTIPKTESDEVIKSSAKNLLPIPSEYKVTYDDESECDVPVKDESSSVFTTFSNPLFDCNDDFTSSDDESLSDEEIPTEDFKVYLNLLFDDEEINSDKIDPHCFDAESDFIESLSNHDTVIDSSSKFDYLEETQTIPTSPILVEDSDPFMEEIDIFTGTDDLLPLGIESDDYDSEEDIHFLEELLVDDSIPLPENESSDFDHYNDPLFPRPPPEPPDVEFFFDFELNSEKLIAAVINNIDELNEDECFDP
nr:hypothetical protein [Tanacetum cinerariifolium]